MRSHKTPPPQFEDADVVGRCLEGDTRAFSRLVEKYQAAVYATAFAYVHQREVAEEVAQESFVTAFTHLKELRNPAAFGPWLKEIVCREALRYSRQERRERRIPTPLPFKKVISIEEVQLGTQGPRDEVRETVYEAIDSLPERYRLPVVLRYLQELSYREIADFLGVTQEEIRGILQRAARLLREKLGSIRPDEERGTSWHPVRK